MYIILKTSLSVIPFFFSESLLPSFPVSGFAAVSGGASADAVSSAGGAEGAGAASDTALGAASAGFGSASGVSPLNVLNLSLLFCTTFIAFCFKSFILSKTPPPCFRFCFFIIIHL